MLQNPSDRHVRPGQKIPADMLNRLNDFARAAENAQGPWSDTTTGSPFPVPRPSPVPEWEFFPAQITGATTMADGKNSWQEQIWNHATAAWDPGGRSDVSEGIGAVGIDGQLAETGTYCLMATTTNGVSRLFVALVSVSGGFSGFSPVLLFQNGGSNGGGAPSPAYASWTYDLYNIGDTGYVNRLNTSGPLGPSCGRCRTLMSQVVQAPNGSVGSAYIAADGTVRLFDCPEIYGQNDCIAWTPPS